jgi:hypothetical protein
MNAYLNALKVLLGQKLLINVLIVILFAKNVQENLIKNALYAKKVTINTWVANVYKNVLKNTQ